MTEDDPFFDDGGRPCGSADFHNRMALCRLLGILLDGTVSAERVGRRAYMLAFHLKAGCPFPNQRELAGFFDITEGRVSQELKELRAVIDKQACRSQGSSPGAAKFPHRVKA